MKNKIEQRFEPVAAKRLALLLAVCAAAMTAVHAPASATPGGVDGQGCHSSKRIGHHCHPERASHGGLPGGETQAQRDRRLKRECKGQRNAGACLGFGSF